MSNPRKTTRRPNAIQGKETWRICNMEDCGNEFNAVDHMRSCPKCTNIKLGESYAAGMDERNLGYIG